MVDGALCMLGYLGTILVASLVWKFWKKSVRNDLFEAWAQSIACYLVQMLC
jgi:hypothetical protein